MNGWLNNGYTIDIIYGYTIDIKCNVKMIDGDVAKKGMKTR